MAKTLILCDCLGSQSLDAAGLERATGLTCSRVHTELCRGEADSAARALADGEAIVACAQQAETFAEIAEEIGAPDPLCVDLRDRAGWSDQGALAMPKMAALLADAQAPGGSMKAVEVVSEGLCLILGAPEIALAAARDLAEHLAVTVLLEPGAEVPEDRDFDIVVGRMTRAAGAFGGFELWIDGCRERLPGGRGAPALTPPRDGARTQCDVILDLRRGVEPLFPAPEKRDGYLRADPGRPEAVRQAVLAASHLTGTFEKPLYVALAPQLCAHSRAGKPACSNCLDACPTGAITSAGEHVAIDPMICAGCGACSALCPTGAITAEDPAPAALFGRIHRMAEAYRSAGGTGARLLVMAPHGGEMVRLAARHGRGLPADVIPLELARVAGFGHAEMLAALASGFAAVDVLLPPGGDRDTLARELALATALAGPGAALRLLEIEDPEALSDALYDEAAPAETAAPILPMGSRRQVARLAARRLNAPGAVIPLPQGAPYGSLEIDTDACTLCLACASLCPPGALGDNPDLPQLRFQEDACVQCGLCANLCPEQAIRLVPQMDLSETALSQRVLNEEEPFPCIGCGKLFGARSTIERITEKLAGVHPMFATSDQAKMIQMCDDCRVQAQYHSENNPFAMGERPRIRTTDDYLTKRRDH